MTQNEKFNQAAHCAAQGKVGSGFDVASAGLFFFLFCFFKNETNCKKMIFFEKKYKIKL